MHVVFSISFYLQSPGITSQSQSQRREILRPPPFVPSFNTAAHQSSVGARDEKDNNVTTTQESKYLAKL